MLKNLWYVIAPSTHLRQGLLPVRLLGQDFVAFRDEQGQARLLSDICVHRGASLSAGRKVGAEVQCPYHGWRFGGDGVCTHIPAQPDLKIPAKARVDSYPVIERHGWIWGFLGDTAPAERPPLPPLDWIDDPGLRVVRGHFDWQVNWERIIENGLDFAHAPFVHGSSFGDPDHPEMAGFEVEADAWSGQALMTMRRPVRKGWRRRPTGQFVEVATRPGFHLSGPCTTLELRPRDGWVIHIVAAHVPVDATTTRTWWAMGRSFLRSALFDRQSVARNLRIFREDRAVLERVRPQRVPDSWQREVSVKSDALQIAFRQRVKALAQQGWQIDEQRIARDYAGRAACVLPGPARREVKSWAIEEIPCVRATPE